MPERLRRLPSLAAERVVLRPPALRDAADLYAVLSDAETMRYWSTVAMTDPAEARRLIEMAREEQAAHTMYEWALALRADNRVVGSCCLFNFEWNNGRAELGFVLVRRLWGQGLMREGLVTLLDFAFGRLGLRRLEADVDPRNEASLVLLERLGFRREGVLRERWNVGGELQDAVLLGLLAREYRP
jgi:[ribosomal protein S5]-alanine N-acetyltransferase